VDVARSQRAPLQVAVLIEHEQRVVAPCRRSGRCRPSLSAYRRLGSHCCRCPAPTRSVRAELAHGRSTARRDREAPSGSPRRSSRRSRNCPSGFGVSDDRRLIGVSIVLISTAWRTYPSSPASCCLRRCAVWQGMRSTASRSSTSSHASASP